MAATGDGEGAAASFEFFTGAPDTLDQPPCCCALVQNSSSSLRLNGPGILRSGTKAARSISSYDFHGKAAATGPPSCWPRSRSTSGIARVLWSG